ncbi:MAG: hypothetical protein H6Q53_2356, partial [Deltaproteobacteria bacterium]|nr:hypothetical protein [Deltaproteobacteria bacterium]
ARYFPIFEHHPEDTDYAIDDGFPRTKGPVVPEKV